MMKAQKGFSLAELLIALALLGIIAAFTIPKLLSASSNGEASAKVREAASTLASAYDTIKQGNTFNAGTLTDSANDSSWDLYSNLSQSLNYTATGGGLPPTTVLPATHPCVVQGLKGWIQMQNGVVITGLYSGISLDGTFPGSNIATQPLYQICIDFNGKSGANAAGQDIFIGNFHQWAAPWNGGANDDPARPFFWGSSTSTIYDNLKQTTATLTGTKQTTGNLVNLTTNASTVGSLMGT